MQEILPLAEGDFEQTKHRLRTITMADFCRMLRTALANKHTLQTRAPLKHLFIDEFQDTDNAQIDLVSTIAKLTAARLFVVGDVKQSIYRFRGAQATAFQSLEDRMRALEHEAAARFTLQRNYRSAPAVLGAISPRFEAWGSRGHLPYAPATDALMPTVAPLPGIDRVETTNVFPELTALVPKLVELRRGVPAGERMAVLVRTNREARQLHAACRRAQIASQLSVGGTLFRSEAAFDLAALVRALLHPHDPPSLAALCDSAYAPGGPLLHELVACNGNHQALATLYAKTPGVQHIRALAERLRTHPLLAVIHEAIELLEPARHHETEQYDSANSDELRAQAPDAGARYRRNLDRILSLVHERFRHDALSAYALLRWLDVQRSTNRTEDEPNADATKSSSTILIKTAHSAKGLEYHTVVVRLSTRGFVNEKAAEIVRIDPTTSPPRIGWKLNRKGGALCSPRFHELENIESGEALREEARLLYVALTRAKRRLVLCPQQAIRDVGTPTNWCSLLGAK
jgi:DNA helicase-2/ATP-dependent DNA helicase PcrA